MLIITGHYRVDPEGRDAYIAAFADLQRRARQAPGCLDVAITADSLDPSRVNNLERWESHEAMESFRAVANPPHLDEEMHDVQVRLYTVTDERDPFD
ncbi:putative quinol monooxygenase [Nocardioides pantholopis]|uniref:putative quinol monooxygenase n=1 Tax=Nocardioides pantholopis TaxID=2483798 RepID=UPI000F0818BA|nr:antibiotic biosynthesis monooxygenase family protein [Nocardioides pantholopis]